MPPKTKTKRNTTVDDWEDELLNDLLSGEEGVEDFENVGSGSGDGETASGSGESGGDSGSGSESEDDGGGGGGGSASGDSEWRQ
eukprot:m.471916 g.471916  ORF g.471916 m.471916 type:complete len:84 (+) comp20379_c1_seq5:360-611(+)